MNAPHDWSLVEARDAVAGDRISSCELLADVLDQADRVNPRLNAFLRIDREAAAVSARLSDIQARRGEVRGGLHGVPLAHKDMFHRRGVSSSYGTAAALPAPTTTATVLEKLDAAGALQFGVLNMSPFAVGPTGHNKALATCRNPWDTNRIAGGSSSGSAAAVAARATFAALGSDTAGSIRIPAALCGVTGLKPTYGRVSRAGTMPFSFTLDTIGPIARSAMDCALMMEVIAGPDGADPTASTLPPPAYTERLLRSGRSFRIGVPNLERMDGLDPEIAGALSDSLDVLGALGHTLVPVDVPALHELDAAAGLILSCEAAAVHASQMRSHSDVYGRQIRTRIERGFAIPAPSYLNAVRSRAEALSDFLARVFPDIDALHLPVVGVATPTLEDSDLESCRDVDRIVSQLTRYTRPFNYLGLPAMAVPIGFLPSGMPSSMQLVARPFGELSLLAIAHQYQTATDWHVRAPPIPAALPSEAQS